MSTNYSNPIAQRAAEILIINERGMVLNEKMVFDQLKFEFADKSVFTIDRYLKIGASLARKNAGVRLPHKSGTKPDTSLFLGEARRIWLQTQGGVQPTIQRLIDEAMQQ